jgi:hypothetical protein
LLAADLWVMSTAADTLRQRAASLRALASTIENTPMNTLGSALGPDVWMGPTPQRCRERVEHFRRVFLQHADNLRWRARQLERRAENIDAADRIRGPR